MDSVQACITNADARAGRFVYEATSRESNVNKVEFVSFVIDAEQAELLSHGNSISVSDYGRSNKYVITEIVKSSDGDGMLIRAERKVNKE